MKKTEYYPKEPKELPVDFISPLYIETCRKHLYMLAKDTESKSKQSWYKEYFDYHITQDKRGYNFQLTRNWNWFISVHATGYLIKVDDDWTHILARLHSGWNTYATIAFFAFISVIGLFSELTNILEFFILVVFWGLFWLGIQSDKNNFKQQLKSSLGFYIDVADYRKRQKQKTEQETINI